MTVAILVYHRIVDGPVDGVHDVPQDRFRRQLDALADLGTRHEDGPVLRLPDGRGVILSFDDATADHRGAAEALERRGWRGLFLIPTGRLGEAGRLTEPDIRDLARRGHAVGAHGVTHRRMDRLTAPELDAELGQAAAHLADLAGAPVAWLAPPGGLCPPGLVQTAARHGYRIVRSVRWGYAAEPLSGLVPGLPVLSRTATATVLARAQGRAALWPGHLKDEIKRHLGETGWEAVRRWLR